MRNFSKIAILWMLMISSFGCDSQSKENQIVLVNSGYSTRIGLAREIAIITSMKPAVVAIDFQFPEMEDAYNDSMLISALRGCDNLVMSTFIEEYVGDSVITMDYKEISGNHPDFLEDANIGYSNGIFEKDEFGTMKKFSVWETVNGLTMYNFAVRIAMKFDSLKTMEFVRNNKRIVDIDFKGSNFKTFTHDDVLGGGVRRKDIQGKIVVFGFLGSYAGYVGPLAYEDKFFTPLNNRNTPPEPDMYGLMIIANIVNQILN